MDFVFVFNGNRLHFPGGIFSTKEKAEEWIFEHKLEGTLTKYPVDVSAYDWMIDSGYFTPKKPHQFEPDFMANFSPGQYHWHYSIENGEYTLLGSH